MKHRTCGTDNILVGPVPAHLQLFVRDHPLHGDRTLTALQDDRRAPVLYELRCQQTAPRYAQAPSHNQSQADFSIGKLAKSTILNGFAALKVLSEVIGQPNGDVAKTHGGFKKAVEELTGRYYSCASPPLSYSLADKVVCSQDHPARLRAEPANRD